MKVVIDTNILLVSIPGRSRYRSILDALTNRKFTLVITTGIYFEYLEVLSRQSGAGVAESIDRALSIARNVLTTEVFFYWNLVKNDEDDNKFIDAYIAATADYFVTNDTHFNEVRKAGFPPVNIVTADEFLEVLSKLNK